jgi:hypothetical protein
VNSISEKIVNRKIEWPGPHGRPAGRDLHAPACAPLPGSCGWSGSYRLNVGGLGFRLCDIKSYGCWRGSWCFPQGMATGAAEYEIRWVWRIALWANSLYFYSALPAKLHPFRIGEITLRTNHRKPQIKKPTSRLRNGVTLIPLYSCLPIKAFFLAVYQACFLTFVSVFRRFVSGPFPYFSCRPCLPLRLSFLMIIPKNRQISGMDYPQLPSIDEVINGLFIVFPGNFSSSPKAFIGDPMFPAEL